MTPTEHPLQTKARDRWRLEMEDSAIDLLKKIETSIRLRRKWVAARQEQTGRLEALISRVEEAFDRADPDALDEIKQELYRITKEKISSKKGLYSTKAIDDDEILY